MHFEALPGTFPNNSLENRVFEKLHISGGQQHGFDPLQYRGNVNTPWDTPVIRRYHGFTGLPAYTLYLDVEANRESANFMLRGMDDTWHRRGFLIKAHSPVY